MAIGLPVNAGTTWMMASNFYATGDANNDAVGVYRLPGVNAGKHVANGSPQWFRMTGTYRIQ